MPGDRPEDLRTGTLEGLSVLVLASAAKAAPFCRRLESAGARAIQLPAIELRAIEPNPGRDAAACQLDQYDWIIFTSANAVRFFAHPVTEAPSPAGTRPGPRVCAVGPATESELRAIGWVVDLVPREYSAEGVVEAMADLAGESGNLSGQRILLPGAQQRRPFLEQELGHAGGIVTSVAVYENVIPEIDPAVIEDIRANPPRVIVFTSPSTVRNFVTLLGEEAALGMMRGCTLAALGPVTAAEVRSTCREPDVVPSANTLSALADALVERFSRRG